LDGCLEVVLCCTIIDIHAFMCGCRRFKQFMQEGMLWVRGVVRVVCVGRVNVALCVQGVRGPTVVAGLPCLGLFDHWRLKLPYEDGWVARVLGIAVTAVVARSISLWMAGSDTCSIIV
jgi:hypothetical protein